MSRTHLAFYVVIFLLFSTVLIASPASEEAVTFDITTSANVSASGSTLERLIGKLPSQTVTPGDLRLTWTDAFIEAEGREPFPIEMDLKVTVGNSMTLGRGLISKVENLSGTIRSGKSTAAITVSQRGTWIAKFSHVAAQGDRHLGMELPLSFLDLESGSVVAQSNLIVGFDLSKDGAPTTYVARFEPINTFAHLRIATTDIASALSSMSSGFSEPKGGELGRKVNSEMLDAPVHGAILTSASKIGQVSKWLDDSAMALYHCGSDEYMEVTFDSTGFEQRGKQARPFSFQMQYRPQMNFINAAGSRVAYIVPTGGSMTFSGEKSSRMFAIGPGDFAGTNSQIIQNGNDLSFNLGLSFIEPGATPIVASVRFDCTVVPGGLSNCESLTLAEAAVGDVSLSPRNLGELFSPAPQKITAQDEEAFLLATKGGGGTTRNQCESFAECPGCLSEGCFPGEGTCVIMGTNCPGTGECNENPGGKQCCRGGFGTSCCRTRWTVVQ